MPRAKPQDGATVTRTVDRRLYRINLRRAGSLAHYAADVYLSTGRRVRVTTGTDDLEMAIAVAHALDLRAMEGTAPAPEAEGNPSIARMADWYLDAWLPNQGLASESLRVSNRSVRGFVAWGAENGVVRALDASVVTLEQFKAHLFAKGACAGTVAVKFSKIRAMYRACAAAGMVPDNVVKKWVMPKVPQVEVPSLEPEQLAEVLRLVDLRSKAYAPIIHWMALTGNRPSDAMGLQWSQVDLSTRTVRRVQVKTKQLAEYQLGDAAIALLVGQRGPRTGVVFKGAGDRVYRDALADALSAAVKGTAFEWVTPRTFRHTFGYIMANHAGCPLPILQRLMGHANITTTMQYVRGSDAQESLDAMAKLLNK